MSARTELLTKLIDAILDEVSDMTSEKYDRIFLKLDGVLHDVLDNIEVQ